MIAPDRIEAMPRLSLRLRLIDHALKAIPNGRLIKSDLTRGLPMRSLQDTDTGRFILVEIDQIFNAILGSDCANWSGNSAITIADPQCAASVLGDMKHQILKNPDQLPVTNFTGNRRGFRRSKDKAPIQQIEFETMTDVPDNID